MSRLVSYAFRRMFSGIRLGQPVIASLGAAVSIIGWLRQRNARSKRELIYSRKLKPGQAVRVRYIDNDTIVREEIVEG